MGRLQDRGRKLLGGSMVAVGVATLVVVLPPLFPASFIPSDSRVGKLAWRVRLVSRKLAGDIPGLSWRELVYMAQTSGGYGLESFANGQLGLDAAVTSSHYDPDDREVAEHVFRERCAVCHGGEGTGFHAPALNRPLQHGDTDLAIYRVIRDGIAGTPMVPTGLPMRERWQMVSYIRLLQASGASKYQAEQVHPQVSVGGDSILKAGTNNEEWLTYSGTLDGRRFSSLAELNENNVSGLHLNWVRQFDGIAPEIEATPLLVNGVIFSTLPPSGAVALDARTGAVLWRYERPLQDFSVCCKKVNRGVAVWGGKVFLGTLDGFLVALDAATGGVAWQTQVADSLKGYSITGAPLIVDGAVVTGVAGGEFGIRGFIAAYEPETGQQKWRFYTIPSPGERGHDTWAGSSWETGGAPTWNIGSYDPALDLLYWGVGNPGPDFNGDSREGDNLYSNSVVALHASTGKLAWYFQFTPHDEYDWDSTQVPILADLQIGGRLVKAICWANRNGFYYVLDRETGRFLSGTPFVQLNWAKGLDEDGRPIRAPAKDSGEVTRPGSNGATNWQNASYDEKRGLVFVQATEGSAVFTSSEPMHGPRGLYVASAGAGRGPVSPVVRALHAATGAMAWEQPSPPPKGERWAGYTGTLATAGGLVFAGSEGYFFALDSDNGKKLWQVQLGGSTLAPAITFRQDGHQVILVSAGSSMFAFGL